MPDRTIIQWDKDDLDAPDCSGGPVLALGMLTALRRCLDLVAWLARPPLQPGGIPKEVAGVYEISRQPTRSGCSRSNRVPDDDAATSQATQLDRINHQESDR